MKAIINKRPFHEAIADRLSRDNGATLVLERNKWKIMLSNDQHGAPSPPWRSVVVMSACPRQIRIVAGQGSPSAEQNLAEKPRSSRQLAEASGPKAAMLAQ